MFASMMLRMPFSVALPSEDRSLPMSGLPAQRLELEVTERLLLENSDGTLAAMEQLKNLGVSISLDDFGTG
jgi:EAL domain-containing protein (putative c-di-GMP-specific phosphodiesterase class I)